MAADLLRRAALKLREHANAASPGDWDADGTELYAENGAIWIGQMDGGEAEGAANAALAALMHPPVALALADLLDVTADAVDVGHLLDEPALRVTRSAAVTLARAVLREDEQRNRGAL